MVSRVSTHPGALVSLLSLLLALAVLAQSLTGNPGVTAAAPALQLVGNGLCLVTAGLGMAYTGATGAWPKSRLAVLGLCLLSLISCTQSLAPYLSALSCASLAGFAGIFLLLNDMIPDRLQWRRAAGSIALIALVSSLHGLSTWYSGAADQALKSTFTNQDCYSVIPLLGGMLSLGLAVERAGLQRVIFSASFGIQSCALLLTASRAWLLALVVGYAGIVFTLGASRSADLRSLAVKLLVLPTALILTLLLTGSNLPLLEKWDRLARGQDSVAIKSRWDVVRYGYRTVLRSPWLGSGLGCFALAYQQDRPPLEPSEDYMNVAHNDYMQWLVETGIPGGLVWTAVLATSLLGSWRCYRCPTPWVAGLIGAVLGIATYTALNFACPVPADFLWIGAILGLAASLENLNRATPSQPYRWNPKIMPLALLAVLAGLWTMRFGYNTALLQRVEIRAQQAADLLDWESAIALLQPMQARQPNNFQVHYALAELYRRAAAFAPRRDWSDSQGQALLKAHQASPKDLQILLSLITYLQGQKRFDEAHDLITRAESWAPYSPHIQRAKARNYILTDQILEATKTLANSERTGQIADDDALADLVFLLEWKSPQSGSKFLSQIYFSQPDRATQLGLNAARQAQELREFGVALRILKQLSVLSQDRPEILLEIALNRGLSGEPRKEIALLERLRQNSVDLDPSLSEKVWRRWVQLQIAQGELSLVTTELEDYLITHPRQNWGREALSEVFLKQGKNSEARAALRGGLAYDLDGSLRIRLGDMCAAQGLTELARGYYREALPLSQQRGPIEDRLKKLGKSREEEEL